MGRSLSTEPSIQPAGDAFHGTASPVRGSLARSAAGENTSGTLQLAALRSISIYTERDIQGDLHRRPDDNIRGCDVVEQPWKLVQTRCRDAYVEYTSGAIVSFLKCHLPYKTLHHAN